MINALSLLVLCLAFLRVFTNSVILLNSVIGAANVYVYVNTNNGELGWRFTISGCRLFC